MEGDRDGQSAGAGRGRVPRVDAHQHFWELESGLYRWPTPAEAAIHRTFTPSDLAPELAAA